VVQDSIDIYYHPNEEIRSFLIPIEIFSRRVEHFQKPLPADWEKTLEPSGTLEKQIFRELLSISGIRRITAKPKELRITKERAAAWATLEPKILNVLKRAVARKRMKVVKG
jgi:hypothetical protein